MNNATKTITICGDLPILLADCPVAAVHSTFASALNLKVAGRLITLLPPQKGLQPYSMVLESWPFGADFTPKAGTAVELHPEAITFCGPAAPKISLAGAQAIDLNIKHCSGFVMPLDYTGRLHVLAQALSSASAAREGLAPVLPALFGESFPHKLPPNVWSSFFVDKAAALRQALPSLEPDMLLGLGKQLAGFGPGLTPASDDFLAGILAGFFAGMLADTARFGQLAHNCGKVVGQAAEHTTFISGCFLRAAAEGLFGENLLQLLSAFFSAAPKEVLLAKAALACTVGSTSGCDTLAGIWFALAMA